MKYTRYKNFIRILAKALAFLKRYRVIILSAVLGVTATVSTLLATNGSFIGTPYCPTSIVYGEE